MRRRSLVGTAVAAVSLIIGVGVSLAAGHAHRHKVKHAKPHPALLHCTSSPTTVPPDGQANVDQPPSSGTEYGPISCTTTGFGSGVVTDTFNVPDSGDKLGTWTAYFASGGSLSGTFDYQPGEGQPIGSQTFYAQGWEGQVTVTGGTGEFKGIKGKNSNGTGSCNSPDSVHSTCSMNVTILIPPPSTSTATGTGTTGAAKS